MHEIFNGFLADPDRGADAAAGQCFVADQLVNCVLGYCKQLCSLLHGQYIHIHHALDSEKSKDDGVNSLTRKCPHDKIRGRLKDA